MWRCSSGGSRCVPLVPSEGGAAVPRSAPTRLPSQNPYSALHAPQRVNTLLPRRPQSLDKWYAHPYTTVLLVTTPLPTGADYSNKRTYYERGWCNIEKRLSGLVKDDSCLWDLSGYEGHAALNMSICNKQMKAGRQPFMSPEVAERQLRQGVDDGSIHFSYVSDMAGVINMYREGFVRAFATFNFGIEGDDGSLVVYNRLGWGAAELPTLVEAIKYADRHCDKEKTGMLTLDFEHNNFTAEEKAQLEGATAGWEGGSAFEVGV